MARVVEVEIDDAGGIHPVEPATTLPRGRAFLTWSTPEEASGLLLSEAALSDWLRPEADQAWAYLQPEKS
jgi:hypothetical protein